RQRIKSRVGGRSKNRKAGEVDAERVTATRKQSRRRRCDRIISFRRQKPAKLVLNEPPLSGNRADRPPKEKVRRRKRKNQIEISKNSIPCERSN
ncbi:unnamed protein product, partial [Brassica napus]